jgi:RHS repeat-associated protein
MIKGGVTYRLVTDHLGSVRLVVDASTGAVAQRKDYNEFGEVALDTNPGFQPFGFAGGLYDPDTGLVRFGARDYDPEIGRWTAKDPLLFDGGDSNLYAYAMGDPINRVDPTGRYAQVLVLVGAEIIAKALFAAGVVGLCILMASSLDDDLIDVFPPMWPENDNECKYAREVVVGVDKTCYYICRLGMRKIEVHAVWPCPRDAPLE